MLTVSRAIAIGLLLLLQSHANGDDATNVNSSSDQLADIRSLIRPAIAHNKLASLHNRPMDLRDVMSRSRWRNSLHDVVRLLIGSSDADERRAGWKLAQDCGEPIEWTRLDIERVVNEPDDEVKIAAVRSISVTGASWLDECIERILNDPAASANSKHVCLLCLDKVPDVSKRVDLWLLAADDEALRATCLSVFTSVSSSESTIPVAARFLEDTSIVNLAVSSHFGRPIELRTLTCHALSLVDLHRQLAAQEIEKRCSDSPERNDLEFHIAAMISLKTLAPDSELPTNRLIRWYDAFPAARPLMLQSLEGKFANDSKLEALIISRSQGMSPYHKCFVCQWMSHRRSRPALTRLQELLNDPHPGVRVAAAIALTTADPLYDLSPVRDDLSGAEGSRTLDLCIANAALSQLSYGPFIFFPCGLS
jgi:hypothetical protein